VTLPNSVHVRQTREQLAPQISARQQPQPAASNSKKLKHAQPATYSYQPVTCSKAASSQSHEAQQLASSLWTAAACNHKVQSKPTPRAASFQHSMQSSSKVFSSTKQQHDWRSHTMAPVTNKENPA